MDEEQREMIEEFRSRCLVAAVEVLPPFSNVNITVCLPVKIDAIDVRLVVGDVLSHAGDIPVLAGAALSVPEGDGRGDTIGVGAGEDLEWGGGS